MPMGGHSPLPLLPQEGRPWGSSPPRPPNASRLLLLSLGAWPLPPAYSIASYTRATSKAGTGGGERGGGAWRGGGSRACASGSRDPRFSMGFPICSRDLPERVAAATGLARRDPGGI